MIQNVKANIKMYPSYKLKSRTLCIEKMYKVKEQFWIHWSTQNIFFIKYKIMFRTCSWAMAVLDSIYNSSLVLQALQITLCATKALSTHIPQTSITLHKATVLLQSYMPININSFTRINLPNKWHTLWVKGNTHN
jgi:hypothetical protein